jgi:hypothetical protein
MLSYLSKSIGGPPSSKQSHSHRRSSASKQQTDEEAKIAESANATEAERKRLRHRIHELYKETYIGLYRSHSHHSGTRIDELNTLYLGAGMSSYGFRNDEEDDEYDDQDSPKDRWQGRRGENRIQPDEKMPPHPLAPLTDVLSSGHHVRGVSVKSALDGVRIWVESSVESLEKTVEVLEAYVNEIPKVKAVEAFLREHQVPLREPTRADEKVIIDGLKSLGIRKLGGMLRHYGARLMVLGLDMEHEVRRVVEARNEEVRAEVEEWGGSGKAKVVDVERVVRGGEWVGQVVFPMRMGKGGLFSGSGISW